MLIEAAAGALIGLVFAILFWIGVRTGLDRVNQGMFTTLGAALMLVCCLWADGWLLTAVLAFIAAVAGLTRL